MRKSESELDKIKSGLCADTDGHLDVPRFRVTLTIPPPATGAPPGAYGLSPESALPAAGAGAWTGKAAGRPLRSNLCTPAAVCGELTELCWGGGGGDTKRPEGGLQGAGQFQLEPWEIKEKGRAAILAAWAGLSIYKQLPVTVFLPYV